MVKLMVSIAPSAAAILPMLLSLRKQDEQLKTPSDNRCNCWCRIAPHVAITLVMLEAIKSWEANIGL